MRLTRQQTGGMHTFSQNSQILQFGLGKETLVDRVTIHWPSGVVQQLSNVNVNQRLVIEEPPFVSLTLAPDVSPVPRGGVLGLHATATNNTGKFRTFLFATNLILPNGEIYPPVPEPLYGPEKVTLAPGANVTEYITHDVPVDAPLGEYIYNGYVGKGLWAIWNEDHFEFAIIP